MIRSLSIRSTCILQRNLASTRYYSNNPVDIEKLEQESAVQLDVEEDQEAKLLEEQLQKKRNKSRLNDAHRNILHDAAPYKEPVNWVHGTLKYQRKLYGKYGEASGVNPAICWPTRQELAERLEYEKVAYPFTIPEMVEASRRKRLEKEERIQQRQKEIAEKMLKLDEWSRELRNKIARKEAEAREAKERRDKLVEEVRRHFGYTVDPREERFKEMLEKKEKEQKKASKEARKKAKQEKMVTKLLRKDEDPPSEESTTVEVK